MSEKFLGEDQICKNPLWNRDFHRGFRFCALGYILTFFVSVPASVVSYFVQCTTVPEKNQE